MTVSFRIPANLDEAVGLARLSIADWPTGVASCPVDRATVLGFALRERLWNRRDSYWAVGAIDELLENRG